MTATSSSLQESAASAAYDRFAQVARAARDNLGVAVDLVMVHNEKVVRGLQPRASLNRAIVVSAVGGWDRFVADTRSAFTHSSDVEPWIAGLDKSVPVQLYADVAARVLAEAGACDAVYPSRISLAAATGWTGVRITALEGLSLGHPGARSGLTFAQHLNQWVTLRNALAHGSIRQLLARVDKPESWEDPKIGDPYASALHGRYRLWRSDAEGDSSEPPGKRMIGATIQAGCARSCLALVVQLVDWLIADICSTQARGWDADDLRLPAEWFQKELPDRFRGATAEHYAHWSLWGGPSLSRT